MCCALRPQLGKAMPQQVGEPINSYGPPPEFYRGMTDEERIEVARQVTLSVPKKEPQDD